MRHVAGKREVWLGIVSTGRPENVGPMHALLDRPATWYVKPGEAPAYGGEGADVRAVEGLAGARNALLEDAWAEGLPAVMLDDDLKRMKVAREVDGKMVGVDVHPWDGIAELVDRLYGTDLYLAGASPTDNAYFAHKESSTNLFIIASLCVVRPCELWFDTAYPLKEDYDYTLQHITRYGGAYRWNMLMPTFQHYSNPGGCVNYRTAELEEQAIHRLMTVWPGQVRRNKKRENEVLLTVKTTTRSTM